LDALVVERKVENEALDAAREAYTSFTPYSNTLAIVLQQFMIR